MIERADYIDFSISEVSLGTAQLGFPYGIANIAGQPDQNQAYEIIGTAIENGINTFDTAPSYGDSESQLGNYFRNRAPSSFKPTIMTKLPAHAGHIKKNLEDSLKRLNVNKVHVYFLHDASDIENDALLEKLFNLKKEGIICKVGVSVYTPEEAEKAIRKRLDAIQMPVNIFDRRFNQPTFLERCRSSNTILFARSIFLQGLFFLEPDKLPPCLTGAREYLKRLKSISKDEHIGINELAISYVKTIPEITSIILGAETVEQLVRNTEAFHHPKLTRRLLHIIQDEFTSIPLEIIDPRKWK